MIDTKIDTSFAIDNSNKKKKKRKFVQTSGITFEDGNTLQDMVVTNSLVSIWRPVNPASAELLSQYGFMGKGLNVKAKSSEFGPLAGFIPYDVRLSKTAMTKNLSEISSAQEKNKRLIDGSAIKITKCKTFETNKTSVDNFNNLLLVSKIPLTTNLLSLSNTTEEKNFNDKIYYFKHAQNDEVCCQESRIPLFAKRISSTKFQIFSDITALNITTNWPQGFNQGSDNTFELDPQIHPQEMEILAYKQYINTQTNQGFELKDCPITADYDELVSAAAKKFPFENNEQITTQFTHSLFEKLANNPFVSAQEIAVELILEYEKHLKINHREAWTDNQQPYMGNVNDWQMALKTSLKTATSGHTNHGPEVGNPHPVSFTKGNYIIFTPDIVNKPDSKSRTENDICELINYHRNRGFPLDVNPKWGWGIDENTGELFVPAKENQFNWNRVEEDAAAIISPTTVIIANQRGPLLQDLGLQNSDFNAALVKDYLSNHLIMNNSDVQSFLSFLQTNQELEKIDGYDFNKNINIKNFSDLEKFNQDFLRCIERLEKFATRYNAEKEIINLKLQIESLRLEPNIIYNSNLALTSLSTTGSLRSNKNMGLNNFENEVKNEVRRREHEERFKFIKQLEINLVEICYNYQSLYKEPCAVEKALPPTNNTNSISIENKNQMHFKFTNNL